MEESVNSVESCENDDCGELSVSEDFGDSGESNYSGDSLESGDPCCCEESDDSGECVHSGYFLF